MICFNDELQKIIYIMAPKCGTTTIAKMLNINIHTPYDLTNINNLEYKIIIIIRKNIIERFLSGFYEDLFNNTCYDNMNITFNDYLLFLYKCFQEKIANVNNISCYNKNMNVGVWYGNCSGYYLNLTDNYGNFVSHIQSQKYAISNIVNLIENKQNVKIIELNNLSIISKNIKENVKPKINNNEINNFSDLTLEYIKKNRIIISEMLLNEKQKKIINNIYKEDLDFIAELEKKFDTYN